VFYNQLFTYVSQSTHLFYAVAAPMGPVATASWQITAPFWPSSDRCIISTVKIIIIIIIIIIKSEKIRVTLCENAAGAFYRVNMLVITVEFIEFSPIYT